MQFSQYPIMVSAPIFQSEQHIQHSEHPRFCILRPGGQWTPLVPLDELPGWLHFSNMAMDVQRGMYPVSLVCFPRQQEWDVVCHHCLQSIGPHQSASELGSYMTGHGNGPPVLAGQTQGFPISLDSSPTYQSVHGSSSGQFAPATPANVAVPTSYQQNSRFRFRPPYVGMCLVDMQSPQPSFTSSPDRRTSMENVSPPCSSCRSDSGKNPTVSAGPISSDLANSILDAAGVPQPSLVSSALLSRRRRKIRMRLSRPLAKSNTANPLPSSKSVPELVPKAAQEQPNSATKRRERRERMKQEKKQSDRGKRLHHSKTRSSSWERAMPEI